MYGYFKQDNSTAVSGLHMDLQFFTYCCPQCRQGTGVMAFTGNIDFKPLCPGQQLEFKP